jgi:hypothetical protein
MNAETVYKHFIALKAHFGSTYDYHRYDGRINTSLNSASYKKAKIFCAKIGKHKDPQRFILANMLVNPKVWVGTIAYSEEAEYIYQEHVRITDSLFYIFKQDIKKLENEFKDNLKMSSTHPNIVLLYFSKEITLETLCIVATEARCITDWTSHYEYDPVMQDLIMKIKKYTPFITYDRTKFRKAMAEEFADR